MWKPIRQGRNKENMWKPPNVEPVKLVFLDRLGWPVERIKGRPILNFLRLLIHTRKIITRTKWNRMWDNFQPPGPVIDCFHQPKSDV